MFYGGITESIRGRAMVPRTAVDLKKWVEKNRALLKPPVGNKLVWEDAATIVMVVGGPNARKDYHVNEGEEFFYQIEGDIVLKMMENGKPVDVVIKEGEIFLMPARVPHLPQRPANTVGLVIEHKRQENELDGFQWYCEKCHHKLYEEFVVLTDIVGQLPKIFDRFYSSADKRRCKRCGHVMQAPPKAG